MILADIDEEKSKELFKESLEFQKKDVMEDILSDLSDNDLDLSDDLYEELADDVSTLDDFFEFFTNDEDDDLDLDDLDLDDLDLGDLDLGDLDLGDLDLDDLDLGDLDLDDVDDILERLFEDGFYDIEDEEDLFEVAMMCYKYEYFKYANTYFNLTLNKNPNNKEALFYNAICLNQLSKFVDALVFIDKAIKQDSKDVRFLILKSETYANLNKMDEAYDFAQKAVELDSEDSNAWFNLAVLLKRLERNDESIEAFIKLTEIDKENFISYFTLYDLYYEKDDLKNAEKYVDLAEQRFGETSDVFFMKAKHSFVLNEFEEANKFCKKCLELDDTRAEVWLFKSIICAQLGDEKESNKCIGKAIEKDPYILGEFLEDL